MRVNRGLVFWGLGLMAAGVVALLIQSGAIPDESARDAWRFWPVALIVAGIALIAARTAFTLPATILAAIVVGGLAGTLVAGWPAGVNLGCSGEPSERTTDSGTFNGAAADVELRFSCGEIAVSTENGSDWSVEALHGSGEAPRLTSDDAALRVAADEGGNLPFGRARQIWDVTLPAGMELDLEVHANAASSRLDLRDAELSRLVLDTNAGDAQVSLEGAIAHDFGVSMNAGSIRIVTDGATRITGELDMNAGSLDLCAPEDSSIEIVLDDANITFDHNLDDRGFTESGDTWRLGSGPPTIRLDVNGNAASFTINPRGGCS